MPAAQAAHAVRDKRRQSIKLASERERRRLSSLPCSERTSDDLEAAAAASIAASAAAAAAAAVAAANVPTTVRQIRGVVSDGRWVSHLLIYGK